MPSGRVVLVELSCAPPETPPFHRPSDMKMWYVRRQAKYGESVTPGSLAHALLVPSGWRM